jgi:GxxExxY protein
LSKSSTLKKLLAVHEAQLRTYLKLSQLRAGLLLNFNAIVMKNGIRRLEFPSFSHVPTPPSSPQST